jgi:F420 biosynthesis protein FbiB-like protein
MDRTSIRTFRKKPIPEEIVRRILEAGTRAPSAHNRQPWRFVVLTEEGLMERLALAMGAALREARTADGDDPVDIEADITRSLERITGAPLAVLVCLSMEDMDRYTDQARAGAERIMAIQSVAMSGQNLLLAAHAEGLGACWLCAPLFAPDRVHATLEIPEEWEPMGLILIGYPDGKTRRRSRKGVEEVAVWR